MAKIKYYYDTVTSKYERIRTTWRDIFINSIGVLSLAFVLAIGIILFFGQFFASPREVLLQQELGELKVYYNQLDARVDRLNKVIDDIEHRDDNIYRSVLGAEPIDKNVRNGGVGGSDRYADLNLKKLSNATLIKRLHESIDKLSRKIYIESKSLDEVANLAQNKQKMFASIPAIQPVANRQLISLVSGFGMRIHPVYKVRRMHQGIDFSAQIGAPIYATADGTILKVEYSFTGYGNMVEIDHGFGYKTRYAHMHGFAVRIGQKVKRGELIGYVGNTGLSTGPHLHYEVHINNIPKNPVYYLFNDLSPEEYQKILKLASIENMSLGGNE